MPARRPTRDEYRHWEQQTTRWADIDVYGHMNNARYFELVDTVVNNHLEQATGTDIRKLPAIGVVAEVGCRYFAEVGYPAPVDLGVVVDRLGTSSIVYRVGIFQGGETAAAEARFVHVYVDNTDPARPVTPLPAEIRAAVEPLVGRVVRAERVVRAAPEAVFELIADPARQPEWDGNANLGSAAAGQRVRQVGDVFVMTLSGGSDRENHVVELEEGRRIAWRPAPVGEAQPGHLWRWELAALADGVTRVTHTYDWTDLAASDTMRQERARSMTADNLQVSLDRLAALAETP